MKLLAIQMMTITGMVFACTTTEAWVLKKNPTGGMIGYSQLPAAINWQPF